MTSIRILFVFAAVAISSVHAQIKVIKVGTETDFPASALASVDLKANSSVSRAITTFTSYTLIGAQTGESKDPDTVAQTLIRSAQQLLKAEKWKLDMPWSSPFSKASLTQIYLNGTKGDESIDIYITVSPRRPTACQFLTRNDALIRQLNDQKPSHFWDDYIPSSHLDVETGPTTNNICL